MQTGFTSSYYKTLINKRKKEYHRKKVTELESLKNKKPKDFWKYFKSKRKNKGEMISLDNFRSFFSSISSGIFEFENEEAESFCFNNNFDLPNTRFPELDQPFTVNEIIKSINSLKRNKACGSDCLLNEYLLECKDIISSHICDIFNAILNSGVYPEKWTEGIIVPIHKKGNTSDINNYRGITLLSCLSKLFTSVVNARIETFCNNFNIISDAQFGFRKGRSTVDAFLY